MYIQTAEQKRKYYGTLIGILTLVMLSLAFSNNVWGDEGHTLVVSQYGWKELYYNHLVGDCHPVLYLFFVKVYTAIVGVSIPAVKLLSITPMVLSMILGATLVDKYFGKERVVVPSLFILVHATAPCFLFMSVELRVYSWALFFVTYCGLLAYEMIEEGVTKKKTLRFIMISLVGAYCHYFALVSIAMIYAYLFLVLVMKERKNLVYCVKVSMLTIVGYLPGVYVFIKQVTRVSEDGFWIETITGSTIWEYVLTPFGEEVGIYFIIFILALIVLGMDWFDKKDRRTCYVSAAFISIFFLTIMIAVVVSYLMTPVFVIRYAYPTFGLLWLGILIGLQKSGILNHKICYAGLAAILVANGLSIYIDEYKAARDPGAAMLVDYIEEYADVDAILVSDIEHVNWILLDYYFPNYERVKYIDFNVEDMESGDEVYYFTYQIGFPISDEILASEGITKELVLMSNIDLYDIGLYRLYKE